MKAGTVSATSDQPLSMVKAWPRPAWAAESVSTVMSSFTIPTTVRIDWAAALLGDELCRLRRDEPPGSILSCGSCSGSLYGSRALPRCQSWLLSQVIVDAL